LHGDGGALCEPGAVDFETYLENGNDEGGQCLVLCGGVAWQRAAMRRPWDSVIWWELRRIPFNILMLVAGALSGAAIVLIGSVDRAVPDSFRTPFARGGTMPGVELHATAVETLLRGDAIREVPIFVSAIATVVAGLIVGAFVAWLPGRAVEGTAGVLALMVTATYVAFAYGDVWFRATGPGLALAVGFVLSIVAWGLPPSPSA